MSNKTDERYAEFLKEFKVHHEKHPSEQFFYGYAAMEGIKSLTEMNPEFYGKALSVFSCIDSDNKSGQQYSVIRNASILCAAYLVNDCSSQVNGITPKNMSLLAQCLCYEFDFNDTLALLANDSLLSTVSSNIRYNSDQLYACSIIKEHALEAKVDSSKKQNLCGFWEEEIESIKGNPFSYTFMGEAKEEVVTYVNEKYLI